MKCFSIFFLLLVSSVGLSNSTPSGKVKIQKRSYFSRHQLSQEGDFNNKRSQFLAKNRANLIHELKTALKSLKDPIQKEELQLRLANLFIEEYKYQNEKGPNSETYIRKAQGILEDLARKTPPCQRPDEVLFQLAQTQLELRSFQKANELFNHLILNFKQSRFLEEAYLQVADSAFDQGEFEKSLKFYGPLVRNPESTLYLYAHYKSGWAEFNLNRLESSKAHFKAVVEHEHGESRSLALKKEALQDLCYPVAELRQYELGAQFYREQEEPFNRKGLECLAASAQAKGETSQALQLYQSLIDLDSTHRNNASYSLSILETLQKAGNPFSIMTQLQDSLELYLGQSTWKEIFSTDPIFMKQVSSQFELFTRDLAYESHSVAQKTKNAELYNQAQSLYGLFLKYFPDSTEAPKAEFYLAEICFKKNQFKEAAEKYESVYRRPAAPATKQQALEYAVLATGLDLDKNPDSEKTDSFLKLADTFTSQFPRDPKTPEFLYKASFLRYQRNEDKTAYGGFWRIVQQHPSHELAKKAAVSILDILNKQNDYPNLISACKRLREVPSFQGTALARDLGDVLRKAELKQISVSEKTEEYEKAGKAYLQYARSYGSEDLVLEEKAIFNAGVCFEKAKQTSESLKTREYFLKKFPTSSLRKETLLQVAKSYEAMAQPGQAARYFSLFQSENPSHGESPEALRLSGLYFWADSKFELAESSFLKAAHFYPQIRETVENDLLDLYTSENKWEKLFDFLNKARQRKGISFSYYLELTLQLADLQEQKFDKTATALWVEADKLVDKYRGIIQTSPKGPDLIGQVLLKRTTFKLNSLRSIRLQLPQANLEKKLAQKMRILNELEKDFAEIASLGGEPALAATYHAAQAFWSLSEDIDSAPIPSELSGEQLDIYREELSKQMKEPLSKKALAFTRQCIEKDQEWNIFSVWGSKCRQLADSLSGSNPRNANSLIALPPYYLSWVKPSSNEESAARNFLQSTPLFREALKDLFANIPDSRVRISSLQTLSEERKEEIAKMDSTDFFDSLNKLRLQDPVRAAEKIKQHLRERDQDVRFLHLLAFSYLDQGEWIKAKITWLSILARGVKESGVYNNLGVVEALRGHLKAALALFSQAAELGSAEAHINKGFVALAFENGALASLLFEKSLESTEDELARTGRALAQLQSEDETIQNQGLEEIKTRLPNLSWPQISLKDQPCFNCLAEKKSDR